jgi:hypothetical protein
VETHLDGVETRLDGVETHLDGVETRLDGVDSKLEHVVTDTRDIKRGLGVLQAIASDHEGRIQGLEFSLRDHLASHN